MEALLRLTSKRDGDWFKDELRTLGGLDHIVDTGDYLCLSLIYSGVEFISC